MWAMVTPIIAVARSRSGLPERLQVAGGGPVARPRRGGAGARRLAAMKAISAAEKSAVSASDERR